MKYLLTILCINIITCRFMMITITRTIQRTIWLILRYTNGCAILIILKLDFIALLTVIIYLGAIRILFLFIIMMIDSTHIEQQKERTNTTIIGTIIIITWILQILNSNLNNKTKIRNKAHNQIVTERNAEIIRNRLYTHQSWWFLLARIILLTAMIITMLFLPKNIKKSLTQQLLKQIQRITLNRLKSYYFI
uniref:NADH-ubiquinone oxidoreductase chain 6 n=1 Tax=Lophophysema eversa TaxID=1510205 RepID=A0A068LEL0_9METZ|nr:NADH dehydrogenase subunit 6 [Lophophysema eversa]